MPEPLGAARGLHADDMNAGMRRLETRPPRGGRGIDRFRGELFHAAAGVCGRAPTRTRRAPA